MSEGRIIKGRQKCWFLFQFFQVDKASTALYKSQQSCALKQGSDLPKFLNAWQEHLSNMDEQPSVQEFHLLFVEQVRRYRPMAEVWNFLDQGMFANNVHDPPSYDDYLRLCCEYIDRQAKQSAKDLLLGRSGQATPVTPTVAPTAPVPRKVATAGAFSSCNSAIT